MPQTIRERAVLSRAFRDHGYQDRQAFLHPPSRDRRDLSVAIALAIGALFLVIGVPA